MDGKDWSTAIDLTSELIQFSSTYNLLLFAGIGWLTTNSKFKFEWGCKSICKIVPFALAVLSTVICAYFHFSLFLDLIAQASSHSPNPVSPEIKCQLKLVLYSMLIGTIFLSLSALSRESIQSDKIAD